MRRVAKIARAGLATIALTACGSASPSKPTSTMPTSAGSASTTTPTGKTNPRRTTSPARTPAPAEDWPTYHGDDARTGEASSGPTLGRVRKLWSAPVTGAVFAEPLVVAGRIIVATEGDSVYALDAATGHKDWQAELGTPVSGSSLPCGNIDPSGITGTPVADPPSNTLYVVTYRTGFQHELVALDLANGAVRWKRPINPPGEDPATEQQRAALALSRGRVYVSYGGLFGDCGRYHGWVIGAPASGRGGPLVTYRVPTHNEGAIWAPPGPAIDGAGNLYVATGNGDSSSFDYGNAVIKLTPDLRMISFFAPTNAGALNTTDSDLGSTGPILLPGARAFIAGKSGTGFLLRTQALGGLGAAVPSVHVGAAFGGNAYAAGTLYVPTTSGIVAVRVNGNSLQQQWTQSAATLPPVVAGPGVWALSAGGTLYQLDPRTGAVRYQASIGAPTHFATPAVAGGRVYVAAGGAVQAFG